ncbi:MAG: copper amine oxidase N-terminal domain-containing protein [Clostridiales bacterium]|nr:copper amine oxidase N-terminal domain-containing protein [Clostridiales bacterium]
MKIKKLSALLLATVLSVGIFTGCSNIPELKEAYVKTNEQPVFQADISTSIKVDGIEIGTATGDLKGTYNKDTKITEVIYDIDAESLLTSENKSTTVYVKADESIAEKPDINLIVTLPEGTVEGYNTAVLDTKKLDDTYDSAFTVDPDLEAKVNQVVDDIAAKILFEKKDNAYVNVLDKAKCVEIAKLFVTALPEAGATTDDIDYIASELDALGVETKITTKDGLIDTITYSANIGAEGMNVVIDGSIAYTYPESVTITAPIVEPAYALDLAMVADDDNYQLKIRGLKTLVPDDSTLIIINDRTMVPARFLTEKLGGTASYSAENDIQKITLNLNGKTIILTIGSPIAEVDGVPVTMDTPAQIVNERTLLPLRFVSENFGKIVGYSTTKIGEPINRNIMTVTVD